MQHMHSIEKEKSAQKKEKRNKTKHKEIGIILTRCNDLLVFVNILFVLIIFQMIGKTAFIFQPYVTVTFMIVKSVNVKKL